MTAGNLREKTIISLALGTGFPYRDLWAWLDEPFETPPERPFLPQLDLVFA